MTLLLAASLALAACSHDTPPAQASPAYTAAGAAPVVVNAAPASSGMTDMLTGGALGYLLGKSASGSSSHAAPPASSTVVHKTVINQTVVRTAPVAHPPTPAAAQPAASMSVTAAKPASAPLLAKPAPNYAARSACSGICRRGLRRRRVVAAGGQGEGCGEQQGHASYGVFHAWLSEWKG